MVSMTGKLVSSRISQHLIFFNDTATTEIYTLSLHDALPISLLPTAFDEENFAFFSKYMRGTKARSEEHTSELQSRLHLECRLLLAKTQSLLPLVQDSIRVVERALQPVDRKST